VDRPRQRRRDGVGRDSTGTGVADGAQRANGAQCPLEESLERLRLVPRHLLQDLETDALVLRRKEARAVAPHGFNVLNNAKKRCGAGLPLLYARLASVDRTVVQRVAMLRRELEAIHERRKHRLTLRKDIALCSHARVPYEKLPCRVSCRGNALSRRTRLVGHATQAHRNLIELHLDTLKLPHKLLREE
jgi:hypothetical protein